MGCVPSKTFHGHLHFSLKSKTSHFSEKEEKLSIKSSDDKSPTSAANTVSAVVRKIVEEEGEEEEEEEEIEKAICPSMDPKSSAMAKLLALLSESHVQTDVHMNSHLHQKHSEEALNILNSTTWNNNAEDQEDDRIAVAEEEEEGEEEEEEEEDDEEEDDDEKPTRNVEEWLQETCEEINHSLDTSSDRQQPIIASSPVLIENNSNVKEERVRTEKGLHKKKAKARRSRRRQQQPSFEFKTVGSLKEWLGLGGQIFSPPGSFHTPKFGGNNSANLDVKDVQN